VSKATTGILSAAELSLIARAAPTTRRVVERRSDEVGVGGQDVVDLAGPAVLMSLLL